MTERITYALLSPTFGMHQYTADLARRARGETCTKGCGWSRLRRSPKAGTSRGPSW